MFFMYYNEWTENKSDTVGVRKFGLVLFTALLERHSKGYTLYYVEATPVQNIYVSYL